MSNDEEKEMKRMLENTIEMNPQKEIAAPDVDVAAEEEKSIDYTD
jgi:hypothetical protein